MTQIEGTLRKLFGYSQFQLIGEARKTLKTGEEDWLASSKYFSLHVDSRGEKADAYVLNLKLFQEQKLLLETKAKLSKASPLIIRGPQVGDGQLVIVLMSKVGAIFCDICPKSPLQATAIERHRPRIVN